MTDQPTEPAPEDEAVEPQQPKPTAVTLANIAPILLPPQ